jgi:hypothetical protein
MVARDIKPGCFDRADHEKEAYRQSSDPTAQASADPLRDLRKPEMTGHRMYREKGGTAPVTTWNQQERK